MFASHIGNESAPIQLAQCWFPGRNLSNAKLGLLIYFFQIKYTEAVLSNNIRKLSLFEIIKMLIAVYKLCHLCFYYNFRHTTFVHCGTTIVIVRYN